MGLSQVRECPAGDSRADNCGVYYGTPPNYTPDDRGPPHFGGVPGAERRRGSPPRLYWWEQEVELELSSDEEEEEEDWLAG